MMLMNRHEKPTIRRDFLRNGLRSLMNAGFGDLLVKLERVGELVERDQPKPALLTSVVS